MYKVARLVFISGLNQDVKFGPHFLMPSGNQSDTNVKLYEPVGSTSIKDVVWNWMPLGAALPVRPTSASGPPGVC